MRKKTLALIIILLCILLSGCWDMLEINNRIFPYSIGIDLNEDTKGNGDKYIVTVSYPNINSIGKDATQEEKVYVISAKGDSILEGANEMSTRLPYKFHFKHLRALVFGKKLSEDDKAVREVLDGVTRDFISNKKIKLIVAQDTAKELLNDKLKAKRQEVIEGALITMLLQGKYTSDYTIKSLSDFIQETDYGGSSLMPIAIAKEEDIKFHGASVFKDYTSVGQINHLENRALMLMIGEKREAVIGAPFEDTIITFTVSGSKAKKKLIEREEGFKIQINIQVEGKLQEYILKGNTKTPRDEFILNVESALEKETLKDINMTLNKLQKELKADVLGIGEYISKFHPKIWEKIKDDWNQVFPEIDIEYDVNIKVRRRGLTTIKGTK